MIIPFSAQTKQGREEIYDLIDSLLAAEKQETPDSAVRPDARAVEE